MNRKHTAMVNRWIKDRLGDLAPDVLSAEVRYKILFKIYKKKYKKLKKELKDGRDER